MTEQHRLRLDNHAQGSRRLLWRTVTISTLLGFVTAIAIALVYALSPSMYEASTLIRIDSDTPYIVFKTRQDSRQFIRNQVEMIRSRLVLGPVKQAELERAKEIDSRLLRLRTERRAPERVVFLSQATAPSARLDQIPFKRMAVISLGGFCLTFLCSGLVCAVVNMRRQRQQNLAGIHVGGNEEECDDPPPETES